MQVVSFWYISGAGFVWYIYVWYVSPFCPLLSWDAPALSHAPTFLPWLPAVASCGSALSLPLPSFSSSQLRKSCKSWNKINAISLLTSLHDCIYNQGQAAYLGFKAWFQSLWCLALRASWILTLAHYPQPHWPFSPLNIPGPFAPPDLYTCCSSDLPRRAFSMSQLSCHLLREASFNNPVYRDWVLIQLTLWVTKCILIWKCAKGTLGFGHLEFLSQLTVVHKSGWH